MLAGVQMHPNQLTVSVEAVRELVDEQFPEWRELPIRQVASQGTVIPEGAGPVKSEISSLILFSASPGGRLGRAEMRFRGPGSAGGRPRSGRRSWTPRPLGACCSRRRRRLCGVPFLGVQWMLSSRVQCRCPGWSTGPVGAVWSFLRRAGAAWSGATDAVGWGQSKGATSPAWAGGQTDHGPHPTAGCNAHAVAARRRTVPSRSA
jgi:hypothetical protein